MRLIVEVFGRAWMCTIVNARLVSKDDEDEQDEDFKQAPVDPHSVGHAHVEHGPGADCYTHDVVAGKRRFGFHGREK